VSSGRLTGSVARLDSLEPPVWVEPGRSRNGLWPVMSAAMIAESLRSSEATGTLGSSRPTIAASVVFAQ
jgi:hypothetical protein